MRELTWFDPGFPVLDESVSQLERELARVLPADCRQFLALHQGGAPNETDFTLADPRKASVAIGNFLLVDGPGIESVVGAKRTLASQELPSHFVPIANGPGGDFVCLDYSSHPPRIAYWHHERVGAESATAVAAGFSEFLELLRAPALE